MQTSFSTINECQAFRTAQSLSCEAFITTLLDNIWTQDQDLGAFEYLAISQALAAARYIDANPEKYRSAHLAGIPVAIKDIIDVANMPTTFGCAAPIGYRAARDATIVRRLKAQGAIIIGKTVTTELAFLNPARTHNPHGAAHTPGGSSAGSAAAVAAGMLPLAVGTQTGGSVIRPAAFCGVFGLKPSFGLLDRFGVLSQSPSLDTLGFMANDITDLVHAVTACATLAPNRHSTGKIKLAELRCDLVTTAEPYMQAMMDQLGQKMRYNLSVITKDFGLSRSVEIRNLINDYELHHKFNDLCLKHGDTLSDPLKQAHLRGAQIGPASYFAGLEETTKLRDTFVQLLADYDCLLMPSTLGEAPHGLSSTGSSIFNGPWTLLGFPVIHLPLFTGPKGMPIGVQLIGAPYSELSLLNIAKRLWSQLKSERG